MRRRHFLAAIGVTAGAKLAVPVLGLTTTAAAAAAATAAGTGALPGDGPIRVVVGFAPGGGTDVLARVISQQLAGLWKRSVVVENRPGATGVIAADAVARAPADGTTLLMAHVNSNAIAPNLMQGVKYDPRKDFTPIALVGVTPNLLTSSPSSPARDIAAVVAACKARPGQVSFASSGIGSAQHLSFEMFKLAAGIDAVHVPYKGSSALVVDLLGGQIDYAFDTMTAATPFVKQGKVIAIAQTRLTRAASFPDVPTLDEAGFKGIDAASWYGFVGPRGLPAGIVQKMNADINTVLAMPEIRARLDEFGAEDAGGSAEKFAAYIDSENTKWARVIREANVKAEA